MLRNLSKLSVNPIVKNYRKVKNPALYNQVNQYYVFRRFLIMSKEYSLSTVNFKVVYL